MADELKSCPFCGSKPLLDRYAGLLLYVVTCRNATCGINGPDATNEKDAIAAWNRRVNDADHRSTGVERVGKCIKCSAIRPELSGRIGYCNTCFEAWDREQDAASRIQSEGTTTK